MASRSISKATLRSLKDLEEILTTYAPHWEEWCRSGYGVLNPKEYQVIESYRRYKTHRAYADKNGVTARHVASVYMNGARKVKQAYARQRFRKWLVYRSLRETGLARPKYDLDSLIAPVSQWLVPTPLATALFQSFLKEKPVTIPDEQIRLIRDLNGYDHFDLQNVRKSHLCIHLYLGDAGVW